MKTIFIDLFGKPEGIVIFQLLAATRFTVYLSLISFIGGAFLAAILAYFSIKKNKSTIFRQISDYISGMTDRFALNLYNKIK